ncbi:AAA family ATPase [Shewanella sp. D64]|uniref:AAA family ATPase n=1 Tax=unclassified Shewanella TaxID=196818 RepID=UPI0022BA5D86|nr:MULTISPECIES: AAA family ATPase [unclassified Shewanella]MEC4725964.1 AAA family ATPase [Shewanella sp. D64]MEC4737219.1 AAA family ATPase [Shewanella sp. E94]WBJ93598.1 AAA family ATPase [Shewanella sp. MTB7]
MIMLVGGEKGGAGKSCLAQNLAVHITQKYQANVLMVDCDPQRTTSDWIQARNEDPELPTINCIQLYGKIRNDLLSQDERFDYVIVDCGGQDNLAMRAAMSVATYVLLPLRPKRRDLKTLPHMEDMLSTCKMVNPKMVACIVMTQCPSLPSQYKRILEAKEVVQSFGLRVLNSVTFSRNIYDDSEEQGASVMEIEPEGKAAIEIVAIADEIFAIEPENCYELN